MQRLDADARSTLTSLFFLLMQQPRHKASIHVESKASTDSVSTWSKSPKVPFRTAPHQNDPHVTHTSKSNNPRANGLLSKNKGGKKTSQTEAEGVKKCAQINKMNRRTKKKEEYGKKLARNSNERERKPRGWCEGEGRRNEGRCQAAARGSTHTRTHTHTAARLPHLVLHHLTP